ncbi:MAG: response regulator transcription factor [Lachnospiraceae bacterium]|nr:response regulator transcription factor [Lachnospiraceae bacterium]
MISILVVEDERAISDLIKINLESEGYKCTCAYNGMDAANILEEQTFDLVLLDIMLPEVDGYELLEYIKPTGSPVIFITAKSDISDRVKGLSLGAEDYIVKPFEVVELLARVNVVLRRFHKQDKLLTYDGIVLNTENFTATKDGTDLGLTRKEFELLELFLRNINITLFREKIYETVWETEFEGDTRTLDLHIQRLRKKTGLDRKLKTVYKVGYRLEDQGSETER